MPGCIAIIAGRYPALSETFVLREVQGLGAAGIRVRTLALHGGDELEALPAADVQVYGSPLSLLASLIRECLSHPILCARTWGVALHDALWPSEPMSLGQRAKLPGQALAAVATARRIRSWGITHLHCHFAHAPATVGMYLAMQLRIPFSFVGHANDLFQRRSLLRRKLQRAAFVSCISRWHRELYLSFAPGRGERFPVIRCGVDVDHWQPRPMREASQLRLISVCRLVEKKGIDTLIRALACLRQQGSDAVESVTVVGDGPQRAELQALAKTEGVTDLVRFAGALPNEQVRLALMEADAFVLPCREDASGDRDGIPVVLMEAMACGLPVISGDLPAIRELVRDGETGLLADGANSEAVAQAIVRLAGDVGLRRMLSQSGVQHVRAEFSLSANIARLRNAILDATGEEVPLCQTAQIEATA